MSVYALDINEERRRSFYERLEEAGLQRYLPLLKGGEGAVQLNHVLRLEKRVLKNPEGLSDLLTELGVTDKEDREALGAVVLDKLSREGGLREPGPSPEALAVLDAAPDDEPALQTDKDGDVWPAGMVIENGHLALSIRQQGLLQEPNGYGYIHLAAEVERPRLLRRNSPEKDVLLAALKDAAHGLLEAFPGEVQRADVFDAFMVHPGAKESRSVLEKAPFDVHVAAFDVVALIECRDVETAQRIRGSEAFGRMKKLLDDAAHFVHCITASNPKRIAEVDHTTKGLFLFNYFFAADVEDKAQGREIVSAVWEYTAGWWTSKANLTNSTPLQPVPGEESYYSLINHCRWDRLIDVAPSLAFRPSLAKFVVRNFTANGLVSMPILYDLV